MPKPKEKEDDALRVTRRKMPDTKNNRQKSKVAKRLRLSAERKYIFLVKNEPKGKASEGLACDKKRKKGNIEERLTSSKNIDVINRIPSR